MLPAYCSICGKEGDSFNSSPLCSCGGILIPRVDFRYRDGNFKGNYPYLKHVISLGEVVTPVVDVAGMKLKLEYFSPTFSYKDRGSKVLISSLLENLPKGSEINEDSSGNAGASIAAYGASAGYKVNIFVPEATMKSKMSQIIAYGAEIHAIKGTREDVATAAKSHQGYYASHVLNPEFRDGMRQISYEIFQQMGYRIPERVFIPVSAGTLMLGVIAGFRHLMDSGETSGMPEIVAVQTEAVCPLCSRINGFQYDPSAVTNSVADALVSKNPPLLDEMIRKLKHYGGKCVVVSEDEIISARNDLAHSGIYVEYSSATVFAASRKIHGNENALLIMTGNGLKTP